LPPVPLVLLISGKFATGVNVAGSKWPPVSTTTAANLPPVPPINEFSHVFLIHEIINFYEENVA
jgi:hypothetical protein